MKLKINWLNSLLEKLRNSTKFEKLLILSVLFSMFLYTFSIPAISGREKVYVISYGLMAIFAGTTILYMIIYGGFHFQKRQLIPILFVAEALIGTAFYSHDFRRWISLVLLMISMFIYYFAFCLVKKSRTSLKTIVLAFFVFGLYFLFVYRSQILHLKIDDRIGTYFDNQNTVGSYFSLAFATSTYIAIMFEKKTDWLYIIPSGLFGICGIFTGSRTFIILVLISVIAILFIRFKERKWLFLIVLGALIGLFFIAINLPIFATIKLRTDQTLYTLFGIGNSKVDHSSVQRVLWQKYGYYLGSRNLLFGYGCEGFSVFSGIGTYTHSNFAEVLCNFGLIGFVLFYSCYIIPFLYCFNGRKKDKYIVFVYFAYFFIKGFLGVSYYYKESFIIIALCMYLTNDSKVIVQSKEEIESKFCEVTV